jgi:hypothetical protein
MKSAKWMALAASVAIAFAGANRVAAQVIDPPPPAVPGPLDPPNPTKDDGPLDASPRRTPKDQIPAIPPKTMPRPSEQLPLTAPPTANPAPAPGNDLDILPPAENKPSVKGQPALPETDMPDPSAFGRSRLRGTSKPTLTPTMPSLGSLGENGKRVDSAVSLEWVCPANIKMKQPFLCELVIRNNGNSPALAVMVRNAVPEGMKVLSAEPKPTMDGAMMVWSIGDMDAKKETRIKLEMACERRGDVAFNATVSSTSPISNSMKVTEPQLVIKQSAPDKVMIGDKVTVTVTVSNPGDGPTEPVVLRAKLSDGLEGEKGQEMMNEIGPLSAGETRVVKLTAKSVKGGAQTVSTTAMADGGLNSTAESTTTVSEAKLAVTLVGPKLRYLERMASYSVEVTNPGDAQATGVVVNAMLPAGFKPLGQPAGGKYDYATRTISWNVGTINPGEKKELSYRVVAMQLGNHKHSVSAESSRGTRATSDIITRVEGIASLMLEMIDGDDPIEVGAETVYEVRVTNHGSAEAKNVEIRALVPKEMVVKGAQGPTEHKVDGQEIIFAPLPKLAPRADVIFRVFVKASQAGDVRFRARLASADALAEPIIGEESTKIYSDAKN